MPGRIVRFSIRTVAAVALAFLMCTTARPACAQTLTPFTRQFEQLLGAPDGKTRQSSGGGGGYWIVSTHQSPQSFQETCPQFLPIVLRHECCEGGETQRNFAELCQSIQPGVPICINVHGSFVTWQDVIDQSHLTHDWLNTAAHGQPVQLINFAWPSGRPITLARIQCDVNVLGRRAGRNGYYLAELIRHLPPESPVCLLGHSHGTRVVASGLHLMGGGTVQEIAHPTAWASGRRIRTVFVASAIRNNWLNPDERYGRALCVTEGLLNLQNFRDPALWLYPLQYPFSGHALGATGLSHWDRRRLGSAAGRVTEVSVAHDVGLAHLWPNYTARPQIAMLIRNYVFFPDVVSP